jgi:tetratricopeptide (TPR) repeat protein
VEIVIDGRVVRLGSGKVGELFTALAERADQVVIAEELIERIWPGERPRDPRRALQALVMRLRQAFGTADLISTEPSGYRLRVPPAEPEPVRPARPTQLPSDLPDFVGRHGEVVRLTESSGDVLVLSGPPGVGKTALAVHVAHLLRSRFPDGQLYGDLRAFALGPAVSPEQVLARFLRALGVPPAAIPVRLDDQVAAYRSLLADRRVLVLLDNATADALAPLVPGTPGSLALVTSRNDLAAVPGVRQLELGVLDADEARDLLLGMLGKELVDEAADAVDELVELCACLPLALRIAAANLAGRYPADVVAYVAELKGADRLDALAVEGDRNLAVQGAFALSYRALATDACRLFRLLGLVPGPDFDARVAVALAGPDAQRLLDLLAAANLVQRNGNRYSMHDLLRVYAARQVEHEDQAPARKRLFDYYLLGAETTTKVLSPEFHRMALPEVEPDLPAVQVATSEEALAWLDAERPNLVAAVLDAERTGPHEVTWLLADQLRSYFYFHNHKVEWLATCEAGIRAAERAGDASGASAMRGSLGLAYWHGGQLAEALEQYELARDLGETAGVDLGGILTNIGIVNWELGRLDLAAQALERSLALHDDTKGRAPVLFNLGGVYLDLGPLHLGVRYSRQALELSREADLAMGQALSLANLGDAYQLIGELDRAASCLDEVIPLYRQAGAADWVTAGTLDSRANVDLQLGNYDDALSRASRALELAVGADYPKDEVDARNTIGTVHRRTGRLADAVEHHRTALATSRETGFRRGEVAALRELASDHLALGNLAEALEHGQAARDLAKAGHMRVCEAPVLTELAAIHLAMGDRALARALAEESVELNRATGRRLGEARALRLLGDVLDDDRYRTEASTIVDALAPGERG